MKMPTPEQEAMKDEALEKKFHRDYLYRRGPVVSTVGVEA